MAIWNDPQTETRFGGVSGISAGLGTSSVDAGLRAYMLRIYNYMASGVLLSGVIAMLVAQGAQAGYPLAVALLTPPIVWVVIFAPLAFVLTMSFGLQRLSAPVLKMLFWAYCALMGVSLASIFLVYTGGSIATAFFAAAGGFAGLSLAGYTTKKSLSGLGTFCFMGLIGLIIGSVANLFMHSGPFAMLLSGAGVLIFAGLIAWKTQNMKNWYYQVAGSAMEEKAAVYSALSLYISFINLFLSLLRLMGNRR